LQRDYDIYKINEAYPKVNPSGMQRWTGLRRAEFETAGNAVGKRKEYAVMFRADKIIRGYMSVLP
jgi:hypothetical protein